ncbi:hypothetical protein [Paracoccus denitrificans]|uniref:hypothetical protein n=1 Tax=Paracoccus denitrificans TaxID=266 RepID=UPI0035311976
MAREALDRIGALYDIEREITSFAQARTHATQSGADVVFDFGGGDILTIRNITINALADDMIFV